MAKYTPKFLKPTAFDPKGHWITGTVWPIEGSTGKTYNVELHERGFACECTGFTYYGKCKHSKAVLEKVEKAMVW